MSNTPLSDKLLKKLDESLLVKPMSRLSPGTEKMSKAYDRLIGTLSKEDLDKLMKSSEIHDKLKSINFTNMLYETIKSRKVYSLEGLKLTAPITEDVEIPSTLAETYANYSIASRQPVNAYSNYSVLFESNMAVLVETTALRKYDIFISPAATDKWYCILNDAEPSLYAKYAELGTYNDYITRRGVSYLAANKIYGFANTLIASAMPDTQAAIHNIPSISPEHIDQLVNVFSSISTSQPVFLNTVLISILDSMSLPFSPRSSLRSGDFAQGLLALRNTDIINMYGSSLLLNDDSPSYHATLPTNIAQFLLAELTTLLDLHKQKRPLQDVQLKSNLTTAAGLNHAKIKRNQMSILTLHQMSFATMVGFFKNQLRGTKDCLHNGVVVPAAQNSDYTTIKRADYATIVVNAVSTIAIGKLVTDSKIADNWYLGVRTSGVSISQKSGNLKASLFGKKEPFAGLVSVDIHNTIMSDLLDKTPSPTGADYFQIYKTYLKHSAMWSSGELDLIKDIIESSFTFDATTKEGTFEKGTILAEGPVYLKNSTYEHIAIYLDMNDNELTPINYIDLVIRHKYDSLVEASAAEFQTRRDHIVDPSSGVATVDDDIIIGLILAVERVVGIDVKKLVDKFMISEGAIQKRRLNGAFYTAQFNNLLACDTPMLTESYLDKFSSYMTLLDTTVKKGFWGDGVLSVITHKPVNLLDLKNTLTFTDSEKAAYIKKYAAYLESIGLSETAIAANIPPEPQPPARLVP